MGYISDIDREIRVLLVERNERRNDDKIITFVKEKVLESYRNGLSLADKADAKDVRIAKNAANRA